MRAYSFTAALAAGLEPRDYQEEAPLGSFKARLDFKIWGKAPVLRCFFSDAAGKKFSLIAVKPRDGSNRYAPQDGLLDFSEPDSGGQWYELTTGRNSKGKISWLTASLPDPEDTLA